MPIRFRGAISARVISSLRIITKVLNTASTTKAKEAALAVAGRDMPGGNAGLDHHQREFADLRRG